MNRSSRASIKFLAEAFAVWCDQKSRLAGARAPEVRRGAAADSENAVLDDDGHDALAETYARTRELIGAPLARAEVARTEILGGPASGGPPSEERMAAGRRACPAC